MGYSAAFFRRCYGSSWGEFARGVRAYHVFYCLDGVGQFVFFTTIYTLAPKYRLHAHPLRTKNKKDEKFNSASVQVCSSPSPFLATTPPPPLVSQNTM